MRRDQAIEILARFRGDAISVATMQAAAPWHDAGQAKGDHVDASGCMGSAASLGLGLALGRPERKVIVLDGDGSLLMQLGSLVTIAGLAPANLFHFVFDNGVYESSGNQRVPGHGVFDFPTLARGAGYREAHDFTSANEFGEGLPRILAARGPVFVRLAIEVETATPRWPGVRMAEQVKALRGRLAGGA